MKFSYPSMMLALSLSLSLLSPTQTCRVSSLSALLFLPLTRVITCSFADFKAWNALILDSEGEAAAMDHKNKRASGGERRRTECVFITDSPTELRARLRRRANGTTNKS